MTIRKAKSTDVKAIYALVEEFAKRGLKVKSAASVAGALKLALADAKPNDLICAAGSIFVIAEVLEGMGG